MQTDCMYCDNCNLQPCRDDCPGYNQMPPELSEYRKAESSAARNRRKRLCGTDYQLYCETRQRTEESDGRDDSH